MADLLVTFNGENEAMSRTGEPVEEISTGLHGQCRIYAKKSTYSVFRDGEDYIVSIGYVGQTNGASIQETLSGILQSFHEARIAEFKKDLVGEYVLLIKKGPSVYLFADFMGTRNVFYTDDGRVVSSSFSKLEDAIGASPADLDVYKVWEYIAMRYILYPTWLGRSTCHKRIKWLLPNEYLEMDLESLRLRVGSVDYFIDNRKEEDIARLSDELICAVRSQIGGKEFADSTVSATLTGGHDSRLIAAIAAEHYPHIRYRIAASADNKDSLKDKEVAEKVARVCGIPLDVHWFVQDRDSARFREFTECFSPVYNHTIAPLFNGDATHSLGLGGAYGTELFMELPWSTIDNYIRARMKKARAFLRVDQRIWESLSASMHEEFKRIKKHYHLRDGDDRDYIRLFCLTTTARYGSFLLSAYNRTSYQIDPYGSRPVLDIALRIAPTLWGNHKRLGGSNTVQKAAMARIAPQMARVMTYSHYRPMLPLSVRLYPHYAIGYAFQLGDWLKKKISRGMTKTKRTALPGGYHLSDGWEKPFLTRTREKYCLKNAKKHVYRLYIFAAPALYKLTHQEYLLDLLEI